MGLFFLRIKLSWQYIVKKAAELTSAIYAVAGLVSLFVSFEGIFSQDVSFWWRFVVALAILLGVWLACAIFYSCIVGLMNKKKVVDGPNGKSVYVVYGDLFDSKIIEVGKRYVCFAVNRCYDTIVDDRLISSNSVHGKAFKRLFQGGVTTEKLNDAIFANIHSSIPPVILRREDKPEGNLNRYEVGSYANIQIDENLNFILLGLSWLNANLNAQTSKSDFVLAIQKMIESFDNESQGFPVLMPIIGAGRSRTDLTEREALEYILEAFRINKNKITSDIYIVIHESAKNRVSIADL